MKPLIAAALWALTLAGAQAETLIRVGHFPNVTHVQALVAHNFSREGKGWFEERLGPDTKIDWYVYNAGPSAMEAVFAESIDMTYVGPSPAINAFSRSQGEEVRKPTASKSRTKAEAKTGAPKGKSSTAKAR